MTIADCTADPTARFRYRSKDAPGRGIGVSVTKKTIARKSYDRMVGHALEELAVDGCITKAPASRGEYVGTSHVDRRKLGMKRSLLVEGYGTPLGGCCHRRSGTTPGYWHPRWTNSARSARCRMTITVHLDAGYDSQKTRDELGERNMTGEIAHKGDKAPIQAGQRWQVERTNSWHNGFNRLQRCYERKDDVIDAIVQTWPTPIITDT